jgi:hypothetical protein
MMTNDELLRSLRAEPFRFILRNFCFVDVTSR